jgi:hypothetical protein
MRILLVGALSWNPERLRSLSERGHRLWGLWSRSMAWDQGPYPATADCIAPITLEDAATAIRDLRIDCIYSLFQVYHRRLWGPTRAGIDHDVWTLLRTLLVERERGTFDVPIVRHWGFDVQHIDPVVTRAFDAHIFCNREKRTYWTTPIAQGGCGVDAFTQHSLVEFLDSDRPKLEFMNDDFSQRPSPHSGEIHTVCIGRPFGIASPVIRSFFLFFLLIVQPRTIPLTVRPPGNTIVDCAQRLEHDPSYLAGRSTASDFRDCIIEHWRCVNAESSVWHRSITCRHGQAD